MESKSPARKRSEARLQYTTPPKQAKLSEAKSPTRATPGTKAATDFAALNLNTKTPPRQAKQSGAKSPTRAMPGTKTVMQLPALNMDTDNSPLYTTPPKQEKQSGAKSPARATPGTKATMQMAAMNLNYKTPPRQEKQSGAKSPTRATPRTKMAMQLEVLNIDSDDNIPVVRRRNTERENLEPFANELPMEEMVSLTAIENYFLKGKNVQLNKNRRKRQKKDKRGERGQESLDEEESQEDEEKEDEKGDKRYEECDLNALRKFHEKERMYQKETVQHLSERYFDKWTLNLSTGFNVLVHGIGSLRPLLHQYARQMGQSYTVSEVEGFRPDCTTRLVLNNIYDLMNFKFQKRRSLTEYARQLAEAVTDRDVVLVIHNIDDTPFRADNDMEVLEVLAACPRFHIVASAQHVNRMFAWNMRSIASFNWVHEHVDTWMPMEAEIFAGSSSLLGLSSAESSSNHTISSLDVLWQSLNRNARSIFHAIFSLVYGTEADSEVKGISFWDLFNVSKDNFWVSSDAALRQQLVEFTDHRLIRMRRGNDGNEKIYAAANRAIIDRFLKEVEMPLEDMQIGEEEEE